MRIAIVGGMIFNSKALDDFLWKLKEKHPQATIVTGQGKGAERHAAESAKLLGFNTIVHEVTDQQEEWFGAAALDCQVSEILYGADVILVVSNGGRCKLALEWWHRMNMHQRNVRGGLVKTKQGKYVSRREPGSEIQLFQIATAKREAKKEEPVAA